jgi:Zn finger protein HypA/HybF involved in hydrogenase expression
MHEVAAMRGVVTTVLEHMQQAGGSRVTSVKLVLGASGHLTEEAARQHFAAFAAGTPAAAANVSISWLPATYQCFDCLHRFESTLPTADVVCPLCGAVALEITHEDVCSVRSIDIACDEDDAPSADEASLSVLS